LCIISITINFFIKNYMNNIENIIEDTKRKSVLVNNLAIDWQYIQQLIPQILNNSDNNTEEFKNACKTLIKMVDRTEKGLQDLKSLIPVFADTIINE
jgi:hypothetical protein